MIDFIKRQGSSIVINVTEIVANFIGSNVLNADNSQSNYDSFADDADEKIPF